MQRFGGILGMLQAGPQKQAQSQCGRGSGRAAGFALPALWTEIVSVPGFAFSVDGIGFLKEEGSQAGS